MEQLSAGLLGNLAVLQPISTVDLVLALASSAVLCAVLAKLYQATHGGYSYSRSFLQTLVMVGITVALIMVIIGSDIARAFALVGAMSIVRFRTPIKDSRDLVYVFAAIAIGMACGTKFLQFAAIFVAFVVVIQVAFYFGRFGGIENRGYVLKLRVNGADRDRLSSACLDMCRRSNIVSISRAADADGVEDVIYEVDLKRGVKYSEFVEHLTRSVKPLSINLLVGEGTVSA